MATQPVQQRLEVGRARPAAYRCDQVPLKAPDDGEVLVKIERFGLSANNVSYAALGNAFHYADFFPCADPGGDWSMLPVWAVARALESRSEWVRTGDLIYGYFPSASHCVLAPQAATSDGFRVERSAIPEQFSFYHRYGVAGRDPMYLPEQLDRMVVLRPLFMTSLLLADYLTDPKFAATEQFVLSSAGSKTALGTARSLIASRSTTTSPQAQVVGLGSAPNHSIARSYGGYDQVLDYTQIAQLPQRTTTYVDFSGDVGVRDQLAAHLGEHLTRVVSIGLTHWQASAPGKPNGSYASEVFFAPGWAARRKQSDPQFGARMDAGWQSLLTAASAQFPVVHQNGSAAIAEHYGALVAGTASSNEVHTFTF